MSLSLNPTALFRLQGGKNLLAFSAGVDSSALFFLLLEAGIPFDMAMVDYGIREQSKAEVAYAKELAEKHGKTLHLKAVTADTKNFEANARTIRYDFFAELCRLNGYETVITAHQLNDRTEWFLMQFAKGAGAVELFGMDYLSESDGYTLVRPMLDISRDEIESYLKTHGIRHFEDTSNQDTTYSRNAFRHAFGNPLVHDYASGIRKTFALLREDADTLLPPTPYSQVEEMVLIKRSAIHADIRQVDRHLKRMGYLLSAAQKTEILRQQECVIGGKIVVVLGEEIIAIAPYTDTVMPKETKEAFRLAGIPAKIRPYLFSRGITVDRFEEGVKTILN